MQVKSVNFFHCRAIIKKPYTKRGKYGFSHTLFKNFFVIFKCDNCTKKHS